MQKCSVIKRLLTFSVAVAGLHFALLLHSQGTAISKIQLPEIRIDNISGEWADLTRKVNTLEDAKCNGHYEFLNAPTTVEAFLGGKVKSIRVVRFVRARNSSTPMEVRNTISRVWLGQFQSASCFVDWQEGALWSIEAIVEFEDGKRSALITDGFHVAMQDHDGKSWFVRLLPAAQ